MKHRLYTMSLASIAVLLLFSTIPATIANTAYADTSVNVTTVDDKNNAITGYWVDVTQSGSTIKSGYSPASFTLPAGSYEVGVSDYGSYFFKQWSDGTTARYHPLTVTATGSISLTAIYSTTVAPPPPPPPSSGITVSSKYVDGSSLVGMYVVQQQNGATKDTGFTPKTFTSISGQQYTIIPDDYTNAYFNKWSDGTATREKVVTATSTGMSLTALYTTSPTPPSTSPDFSVSASPSSLSIVAGSSGTSAITVSSSGGFSSAVALSISPAITGVSASFSPASVTPTSGGSAKSTLTIATTSTATAGTHTLTITGTSGTLKHTASVALTISSPSGPPPGNNLLIATKDDKGNSITGYWVEVKQAGSTVKTGFSPASFSLAVGSYVASVSDYGGYYFSKWSDGVVTRDHSVTITSTGTVSLTAIYSTSITASPDFGISSSPTSLSVQPGTSGSTTINIASVNGFTSAVTLKASAISGFTTTFSKSSVTPPSGGSVQSTLNIAVASTVASGTYTLTITGTSGSTVHITKVAITVGSGSGGGTVTSCSNKPAPGASNTVTVVSCDLNGKPLTGYYTNIRLNGNIMAEGYTPVTFTMQPGNQYVVVLYWCCDNYFRHYDDGVLTRYHYITADGKGYAIAGMYESVPAAQAADLNVIAQDTSGNVIGGTTGSASDGTLVAKPGMWMTLTPPGASAPYTGAYSGSSSTPFVVFNKQSYTIAMSSYGQYVFDHWQDNGSTNPTRSFALNGNSVNNVAVYRIVATAMTASSASGPPFPWFNDN